MGKGPGGHVMATEAEASDARWGLVICMRVGGAERTGMAHTAVLAGRASLLRT